MASEGLHCPFLNRADCRCGEHLNIEDLGFAFRHCFDRYKACAVYVDLLVERQLRRGEAAEDLEHVGDRPLVQVSIDPRYRRHRTAA